MPSNIVQSEALLKALCPAVREVCQPLFNYLSVSFFRYIRSYPDRSKYILCTNEDWLTAYFKDKLYDIEYANFHKIPQTGISIHAHCNDKDPVCTFWNKMSATGNYRLILALYEKHDTYLEFYNFGLKQDTHASNNIFLNNHLLFHHFITYFREKGQNILLKAETAKFECKETDYSEDINNNWMLGLPNQFEQMIVDQMPVSKIYLNGSLDQVFLTREEAIFIRHYLNGFNLEKIKDKMSNSLDDCKNIVNALTQKLNLASEKDLRPALIANRIQKKISFIK